MTVRRRTRFSLIGALKVSPPSQRVPFPSAQASVTNQNNVLPSPASSSSSATSTGSQDQLNPVRNLDTKRQIRERRRYSPYVRKRQNQAFVWTLNCHAKFAEVAKQLGGIDKVSVFAVLEIMKSEMDGVIPTLDKASHILRMMQSIFPKFMTHRPRTVIFFFAAESESESASCDTMVSDFGKLNLAPKTESCGGSGDSDTLVNDLGKLKLEETPPF